jgi:hypothetical protein
VVENPLVLSGSNPLVRLGLDNNFDANVMINIYFDIDINHLAYLHFLLPDRRTFDILSSPSRGSDILPTAIPASSSPYSHSAPRC